MMDFFRIKKIEKGQRNEDLPEKHEEFPDSDKPYGLCPRCNKQSSFDAIGGLPATFEPSVVYKHDGTQDRLFYDRVVSLVCRNCLQPTIVIEERYSNDRLSRDGISTGTINWRGFFWWPFLNMKLDESLSEEIQQVLREAKINFSTQCYRSSAVMSRRALEAIASEKGEVTGNLFQKIKNLTNNGVLDKNLGEWATEIRLIGNSGAHHDPIDDVNKEDASQILLFIEELIKYLYIMPAEIQKRRAKN